MVRRPIQAEFCMGLETRVQGPISHILTSKHTLHGDFSKASLPLQDTQALEICHHSFIEHSILAIKYTLYNKASKGSSSAFDLPTQLINRRKYSETSV